jgi:hypothetical protein
LHNAHEQHRSPADEPTVSPAVIVVGLIYLVALVIGVLGVLVLSR